MINRGVARRTLFEGRHDIRFFLSRLARVVRQGMLEIHAYTILTTHFHLLVQSPEGLLSQAMKVVQNEYVRRFNRARKRDGPLVRGRFRSKPVLTAAYQAALVRYIDWNPVVAGLVDHPCTYPHGSARHYARVTGPPWLARGWVEDHVRSILALSRFEPAAYLEYAGAGPAAESTEWVEARIQSRASTTAPDPVDDLLVAAPPEVQNWMRRKARLADGTGVGLSVVAPSACLEIASQVQDELGAWDLPARRGKVNGWRLARVALLRDLSACSFREIATRLRISVPHAARTYDSHRRFMNEPAYAQRLSHVARRALALGHRDRTTQ